MNIGVIAETGEGERRVAVTPEGAARLYLMGHSVTVQEGAGVQSGFADRAYADAGATIAPHRDGVLSTTDVVISVKAIRTGISDQHTIIGLVDPLWLPKQAAAMAASGATVFSLELIPRITRAQTMDVLSSMSTVAGYEAVLLGATRLDKMFPLLMTAAGTVPAARVLVLGAGVAGLQAIATARRLGSIVEGYDVRPAAAEQIESVGAKSIDLELDTEASEDAGGYAKAQVTDLAKLQQERLKPYVANADLVITTAAIPGARSPQLITGGMVRRMKPGSIIIDLAAERGGNCTLTHANREVEAYGVLVLGPTDLESRAPQTASGMFSNNVCAFVEHLTGEDGELVLDLKDEITAGSLVAADTAIVHPGVLAAVTAAVGDET